MKVVLQRVKSGRVSVRGELVSEIKEGFVLLWGVQKGDTLEDAKILTRKIGNLRVFADESNKINQSIKDINGEILLVSQFTLVANILKGNRPSFIDAEDPNIADKIIKYAVQELSQYSNVKEGIFGENMIVAIENDGPMTITLECTNGKLIN